MTNFCLSYKNFKGFYESIESESVACHEKQQAGLDGVIPHLNGVGATSVAL